MIKNVRFLFAIMLCIANMIIYGLKVNVSTAIIGMVKAKPKTDVPDVGECDFGSSANTTVADIDGPYDWSSTQQGLVVSIYFAGYLIGMFPSGYFADRFNTKWVLLICVFCNSLFTLLVPVAAGSLYVLYALRFLTGLVSAANLPIVNVLVGKWVVYEEKSMWVGIIYAGTSLGTVISILTSGWILNYLGWEMIFYIHGVLPLIWCVVFAIFFADNPETQKYITEEERQLLINTYGHRGPVSTKVKIPWKSIFTSTPFLALIVTNCLGNFCWYFLLTQMPLYMNKMLRFDIKTNSTITCTPYLINAFTNSALGKGLDYGRRRGWWSQTGARKVAVGISCLPVVVFLLIIAYIGCNREVTVFLLCLSIITSGAIFVGHLCNQNDLAPNYAGILMGITNTPGTISAFVLPALVGALVESGHTFMQWRYVFWINIVAQLLAFGVFTIFGSAKIQNWNYPGGVPPAPPSAESK
ncbi:sialin [Nasonia vitripennis]|uniref:Major facilitator superfamily (MFS) profile domain-containing protein n=1 Tax=Nasonia vitripennis TaxID=7425 RepID=A0A7M7TCX0_NASVI|nr:sialin [Nasonia vitripennis]XP_032454363.1 sialin [Nasonia vitripennis]XP_032454369.1 sialin [Nasonia vitripennis]XP_032454370.1 sialin [Nasonia vitripennis]XP_032454371.1 sialin [Nasonia vitripennis]XP_032454373.1 sialin [Nasonia vitripennis]XP_032454374.1 sialin [Nasonia vitripennis]XP_032454375.1 sialin [Nasonia vitripennis]